MLIRIENQGWMSSNVEFEERWTSSMGNSTILPMSSKWKTLGIQVSGGLDSGLLLYLSAKTIMKHGLKTRIKPISFEIPNKVKNLESARAVISTVQAILDFKQISDPLEVILPDTHWQSPLKDQYIANIMLDLLDSEVIDFEFNGNTKNPPDHIRSTFANNDHRQFGRDDRKTIYNGMGSASPHAFVNKQDIVDIYRQHNLIDRLASVTLSCDENADIIETENLPVPCGKCWWCRERSWGFEVLDD